MYHTIFQLTNCTLFLECRFCTSHHIQVAAKKSKLHVIIRRKNKFHNLNSELEKKLLVGESNPGRPRDRRKCYQLHQPGLVRHILRH